MAGRKVKLLVAMPIYGRHELTKIILDHYAAIKKRFKGVELLAVGSEGKASESLVKGAGWNYVEHPNLPVSVKMNALARAARKYSPQRIVFVGSDDLISQEVFEYYLSLPSSLPYMIGFKGIYFYGVKEKCFLYAKGYVGKFYSDKTIGAGRMYSKKVLNKLKWTPWGEYRADRGLDTAASKTLIKMGTEERQITYKDTGGMMVDVKTGEGLTPFYRTLSNSRICKPTLFEKHFPGILDKLHALPVVDTEAWKDSVPERVLIRVKGTREVFSLSVEGGQLTVKRI